MQPIRIQLELPDITVTGYPTVTGVPLFDLVVSGDGAMSDIEVRHETLAAEQRSLIGDLTVDVINTKRTWIIRWDILKHTEYAKIREIADKQLTNNAVARLEILDSCGDVVRTGGQVDVYLKLEKEKYGKESRNADLVEDVGLELKEF